MAATERMLSRRRRNLWLLAGACLLLVVVPWGTATAIRVVRGAAAVVPDQGFESLAMSPAGRTLYAESYSYHGPERLVPVDVATGKAGRPVVLGVVEGMVITPDGRMLYTLLDGGLITP